MKKRILHIVLNTFKNDSRVLKEVTSLVHEGHDITVAALHEGELPEYEGMHGFKVHRVRLATRNWPKNFFVQIIKLAELTARIVLSHRDCNIVHCHDLDPLPIGVILKLVSFGRIKIIYDAHEFQTEQEENPPRIRYALSFLAEAILIRFVDRMITVSEGIACEYQRRYRIAKPALVLNCPPYQKAESLDLFRTLFGIEKKIRIFLYQGGLEPERGVEELLEAFPAIVAGNRILVIMGFGSLEEMIKNQAQNNPAIFFHPAVAPSELLKFTASADVGILPYKNSCLNNYYCSPNKFFEYAMAGLPILANDLWEIGRLIRKYNCGFAIREDNVTGWREGIEYFMNADLTALSSAAAGLAEEYNWENQEKNLITIYRGLLTCAE